MGQHVLHTTGHKTYAYVSAAPEKKTPRTPFCLNERESPLSVRSRGKNACATSAFLLRCRPGKTHRRILLKMEKPFAWPLSPSHSSPLPSPFFLRLKWNESGNGSGWGWFSSSFFLSFLLLLLGCSGTFESFSFLLPLSYRDIKKNRGKGENAGFWNSFQNRCLSRVDTREIKKPWSSSQRILKILDRVTSRSHRVSRLTDSFLILQHPNGRFLDRIFNRVLLITLFLN